MGLRFIGYSRKSSEARERQALSISDQNAECGKTEIKDSLDVVFRLEESKTAFKPRVRPEFDKMITLIEARQADAILVWHLNRLCRNPEEGGKIIQYLQDGVIKEIRTASGDVYTSDSDHLILQIHFGMANQYSRNISNDVKRALIRKSERGEYPRPARIGFEGYGESHKRFIKPNAFEAPIVKTIFELASTSKYSLSYMVNFAYENGLRTKKGKKISKSHLFSILTDPVYYGSFYYKGELYVGTYQTIISKQLFDAVQEALQDRSKPRTHSWSSPYNGLVKCPTCNSAITTTVKTKYYKRTNRRATYFYLHCTRKRGNCSQPAITVDEFEQQLLKNLSRITIDEEIWSLGIKLLKAKHKDESTRNMAKLNHFQLQYKGFQDKLNRLINMRANEELTKEEFLSQKETILKEMATLKNLLDDNEATSLNWLELAENFLNVAFYAREILEGDKAEAKRQLIIDVGKNLYLKDKKVIFSFKKPYDVLLKPQYRTNMHGRKESNPRYRFWRPKSYH